MDLGPEWTAIEWDEESLVLPDAKPPTFKLRAPVAGLYLIEFGEIVRAEAGDPLESRTA